MSLRLDSSSLEGIIKNLANQIGKVHNQSVQYQQKTDIHLQNIDTQIGQICTSLSNLEKQVNRVTLRELEEVNELKELEVISEESINTIKLLDAINFSKEWLSSLPIKYKDPGSFSITCRIGKHCYHKCMLDLGSSVNILPYDIYMMYEFDSLQRTNHTLAMADKTEVKIVGILNNALILYFNRNFFIQALKGCAPTMLKILSQLHFPPRH
ncbi:Unconventional myosin-XVIIIb, partial [Bienertia sinuspersici]